MVQKIQILNSFKYTQKLQKSIFEQILTQS